MGGDEGVVAGGGVALIKAAERVSTWIKNEKNKRFSVEKTSFGRRMFKSLIGEYFEVMITIISTRGKLYKTARDLYRK